jgi:5-methyltetrahydrofolate--homocysteine methyltransferase
MNSRNRILGLLRRQVLILDGAMGTELHKRGLPPGVCPEAWSLGHPEAVEEIHAAYREAGADIVYTSTFGANRLKMGQYGLTNVREANRQLARIAVRAVGRGLVAGDIGPTGHFVEPFGEVPFEEAVRVFREQVQGLLEGGVDLFVIETMMDIQEARAALIAVREVCDLFCMVTMTYEKHGRTLNGTDPVSALVTLQSLGADAVGCNCSAGPEGMIGLIETMRPHAAVPLVAKPNAGLPVLVGEETLFDMDAARYAGFAVPLAAAGVSLMGGCCGTTPAHIRALRDALRDVRPVPADRHAAPAVSSARGAVPLSAGAPLVIAGGRLDGSGNEALRQSLAAGEMGTARQSVRAQEKEGARLLLLKTGATGSEEARITRNVLAQLAATTRSPFLLATGGPETLSEALRFYPGRPLVWVDGAEAASLLPVIGRFGALPAISVHAQGGRAAVRRVVAEAGRQGFSRDRLILDCTPASLEPAALREAVALIGWGEGTLRCRTLLDLTRVGQGMPDQPWLQASLLAAAQAVGLTVALLDPAVAEPLRISAAGDRLRTG